MTIDEKTLTDLRTKHPKLIHLAKDEYEVVFRRPNAAEYENFKSQREDENAKAGAVRTFLASCRIHPDPAAFAAMLDEAAGLIDSFANGLLKAIKLGEAKEVKK